ncbi:MAG: tetratricopeptide repeat protein [Porticoccaceae bacterium]|nr:tetratricopeptide repeat protein [Porticoccaceae bacterium]
MSAHLSEEEQVEALKQWWRRNGRTTIIAVVVGVAAWFGLQQWNQQQQAQRENNSLLHMEVQQLAAASDLSEQQQIDLWNKSSTLKAQAEGSQYGWYAALMLAKLAFEKGDYDNAASELQYVIDGSEDAGLSAIATLRLARVEVTRGNTEQALALLNARDSGDMAASYAELRGDIHRQQGDQDAARIAYQEALNDSASGAGDTQLLQLKLNRVTPAEQLAQHSDAAEQPTENDQ